MTISAMSMLRQAMSMMSGAGAGASKIEYEMKGKLSGGGLSATRFATRGAFDLPTTPVQASD
jgi:hypothetical protein